MYMYNKSMDETHEVKQALLPRVLQSRIYEIRGQMVMLDSDLAELYGVTTKSFNQAVKRNIERFPGDFMFRLEDHEFENLRSQIVTSRLDTTTGDLQEPDASHGGRRYLPYAFTEQGVAMLV